MGAISCVAKVEELQDLWYEQERYEEIAGVTLDIAMTIWGIPTGLWQTWALSANDDDERELDGLRPYRNGQYDEYFRKMHIDNLQCSAGIDEQIPMELVFHDMYSPYEDIHDTQRTRNPCFHTRVPVRLSILVQNCKKGRRVAAKSECGSDIGLDPQHG
jgi:hypothetical protein